MNLRLIGLGTGVVVFTSTPGRLWCLSAGSAVRRWPRAPSPPSTRLKEGQDTSLSCAQLKPEAVGLEKYFSEDPNGDGHGGHSHPSGWATSWRTRTPRWIRTRPASRTPWAR